MREDRSLKKEDIETQEVPEATHKVIYAITDYAPKSDLTVESLGEEVEVGPMPEPEPEPERPWEKDLSKIYTDGRLYKCTVCGGDSPIQWMPGRGFVHILCGHNPFSTRCQGCGNG